MNQILPKWSHFLVLFLCVSWGWSADFAWIEGETPQSINLKGDINGSAKPHLMSDGKWLTIHMDGNEVEKGLPAEGALVRYSFKVEKGGKQTVWGRIGFEFARSPFDWRIDGGAWKTIPSDVATWDLTELSFFTEVAWYPWGEQELAAGDHTLEVRIQRQKNAKGENQRVLFGLDAVCITAEPFYPNGKFKPGQEWRTEQDLAASKVVFQVPETPADGSRTATPLEGTWEVCRDDEPVPGPVAEPIKALPGHPFWKSIAVPGDKNTLRDDLVFAHRIWYRTRVNVPQSQLGRSFYLVFPQNNLNTTVYVNGQRCGFEKHPYVHFQIDVSKAVKAGENEVWVGIRDAYYAYATSPTNPMKLRKSFNLPLQFTRNGFQNLVYPVWSAFQSGILVTPSFVSAGPAYVSDVFCKPSVAKKELGLEVTVNNPSGQEMAAELTCEAVNAKTGQAEMRTAPLALSLKPGSEQVLQLAQRWENPTLWWPDAPQMYRLRTILKVGGKVVDVSNTSFGFREWGVDGKNFTLNGQPWHGWNMGIPGQTKEQWLANYRKFNQTQMRMAGAAQGGNRPLFGMSPDEALDWCDENGVVVRRCGPLDGEAIGYFAIETDDELKKLYKTSINLPLHEEWREQMAAQVKGERNHPSIQIWSIENEWLYINCINLHGDLMDQFEAQARKVSDAVRAVDPTRPTMTDGGGANKAQDMPVHGNHYVAESDFTKYPALAYQAFPTGGGRGRWVWDQKRPRYLGEDFFYTGNHPELATIGGEAAFGGKASTLQACGLMLQILQQGYRWSDYGAWDFYCGENDADGSQWTYMAPRVVLCREWDWSFGSGQAVKRHLGIFNDSRFADPITLTWTLSVGGAKVAGESKAYTVAPGTRSELDLALAMPDVKSRQEGTLALTLAVAGKEIWSDSKAVSVLPPAPAPQAAGLYVYDPAGTAIAYLKARNIPHTALADLKMLPEQAKVLLIGKDALDSAESTSSRLAAYASEGRSLVVLEQKNPLRYQAVPADMDPATNEGRVAFAEDLDHPVFKGLQQKDLFTWSPDEILFRNAYMKPTRGAKSLIQCGHMLANSGLVEVPTGKGVMLLSQIVIGEKLADNAVAQTLLANLLSYGGSYKQVFRSVYAVASTTSQLTKVLDAMGLQYEKSADPLAAIAHPNAVAVIEASPANLQALAENPAKVEQFTASGGFILFNNLTPDGLSAYNRIVGFEHMIRPFGSTKPTQTKDGPMTIERVGFPAVRDPLTAGITTGDIAMYASKRIFPWTDGNYWSADEFSYVIDYDEVAPFGTSPFFAFGNIVNNFTSADGWPLIINFELAKDLSPYEVPITLPKPQTITEFTWVGNTNYWAQTKVNLIFDGNRASMASFNTQPTADAQTFAVNPPREAKTITLQIAGWQEKPNSKPLVGIDNIYLKAQRPKAFYERVRPMLNIGGMMHYVRGPGGIVLCNLKLMEREELPANAIKKQNILAALLRNLNAPFAGGKSIIAGANLEYAPIDLSKQANQFRDEKGWFGDKRHTFRDLPTGKQKMAGVTYDVYEFPTSPVPTVLMLEGGGVPGKLPKEVAGIPVNRKADALFFLQAARIDQRMNNQEKRDRKKVELFHYVVHYADGKSEQVPVYSEVDIENYVQEGEPKAVPGAQIAWARPYEGGREVAVSYSMQWNNPRPAVEITSIDIGYPQQRRGVPAVLAITAASAPGRE